MGGLPSSKEKLQKLKVVLTAGVSQAGMENIGSILVGQMLLI